MYKWNLFFIKTYIIEVNPKCKEDIELYNHFRPKLKLKKTTSEWIWDVIGGVAFIGALIFLIVSWSTVPDQVPAHYNAFGEVDRWGSKFEMLILPLVGLILWGSMAILERKPHVHNYPDRLNEKNVEAFYTNSRKLLNTIKNICLLAFSYITIQNVRVAVGDAQSLGSWFMLVMLIGLAVTIIFGAIKSAQIK